MIPRLLRSIAAGLALAALTIGVPVLLVVFGRSPLDGTGSAWEQITDLPTQAISDKMAFGLLTIGAWLVWALFAAHVVAELGAALGEPPRWRPPAMGPFQMTARRLVVALTMSATLSSSLSQRTASVPLLATAVSASPAPQNAAELRLDVPVTPPAEPMFDATPTGTVDRDPPSTSAVPMGEQDQTSPVVIVGSGDSPWLLAERHLGEGLRWREIWDLNRGKPQQDGSSWVVEDLIRPGWRLQLPTDAVNVPSSSATEPSTTPAEPVLPPPDDEEAAFPPATPAPTAPATTAPTTSPEEATAVPTTPSAPTSSTPATIQQPTSTLEVPDQPATAHDEDVQDEDDDDDSSLPAVPVLGVAGTLLAVAALRELHRRQARRRTKLPTSVVPPVAPRLQLHRELLLRSKDHNADRLDAALAYLARSLRAHNRSDAAQPRVVQVAEHRIDVLLDRPDPAPPRPWHAEASGLIWVLDVDVEIPPVGDDLRPLPALVTVGIGDADILVDLEAYGVVALIGDEDACRGLARSMVTDLSARADDDVAVEIVGQVLEHSLGRLDAVRHHGGWNDVDVRTIETSARLLDSGGWPHTWAARTSGRIYDGWTPTVWVTGASDDPRFHDTLEAIDRRPGAGSALVVVGGDPGCGLRIHLDSHGGFEIPELNLYGATQRIDSDATDQLADLLEDADIPANLDTADASSAIWNWPSSSGHAQRALPELSAPLDWLEATDYEDPPYDVIVRVCGPIRVDGGTTELPQRETAVAAYIALNGEVDIERIRDAVWAGAGVSLKRVRNVISTVRRSLGDAIAFTNDHRLTPGTNLITDLELIRRRLTHAHTPQDPLRKAEILRGALEWVTGRVCTYPEGRRRCWTWIDLDNWIPHVESLVASVASQLAQVSLDLDDGEGAVWAARRGMETTGQRDELTILLVRGYELLGDEVSARQVVRSYERYLDELGVDELNDDLLDLLDRYATPAHHKASR